MRTKNLKVTTPEKPPVEIDPELVRIIRLEALLDLRAERDHVMFRVGTPTPPIPEPRGPDVSG